MRLQLPSGVTYFTGSNGEKICTGSQMGRRDSLPENCTAEIKLHLQRLPFVDQCYDRWGAYWGAPANVYAAFNCHIMQGYPGGPWNAFPISIIYVRANTRHDAKRLVRQKLPNARFYR